ncbi:FMN-binding negative transcriptional regulator [soil metagenome]|jgi:transcriptional regulator
MGAMYVPTHFAATEDQLRGLLSSIQAVDLISPGPAGLVATFLPVLYDPTSGAHGALLCHVARTNEHWRAAGTEAESLVIVRGPDGYVSPSSYPSKQEHGRVVPTWNYLTAHVYGRLVAHQDSEWLRNLVTRLTERHEAGSPRPWQVSDAPAAYVNGQLRAIVGLELQITRIQAKAKLSQNRSEADRVGVHEALLSRADTAGGAGPAALARAMEPLA